jgi:hypothetical protein
MDKVRAGAEAVAEKAKEAAGAAAAKAHEVDDKYKLSEKEDAAVAKVSEAASSVAANPTVSSGIEALQSAGKKIGEMAADIKDAAVAAVSGQDAPRS